MKLITKILVVLLALVSGLRCSSDKPAKRTVKDSDFCSKEENKADKACLGPSVSKGVDEDPVEEDDPDLAVLKEDFLANVKAFSDEEAITYVKESCAACHESKSGSVRSFWSVDLDAINKQSLATDSLGYKVYYTSLLRARGIEVGKPQPMPPMQLTGKKQENHLRFVKWMQTEMASAVTQANTEFGADRDSGGGVGVIVNFKCEEPASFRTYVRRVTNDLFGREPTADELKLNNGSPEDKTTAKDRAFIAQRIFSDKIWKKEFLEKGLRKFASKMSGANAIEAADNNLTVEQAADLKEEFYQILKKNFDSKSYKDIVLSKKIMVSPHTASLYGCQAPASGWKECDLPDGRDTYFSSFSYLASKRSSFLQENNNYGRSAMLYFFVRGDVFKPSFGEDGGGETTKALPSCLKSNDYRGKKTGTAVAAFGTNSIPASANLCQSCHIDRQMATGSIVFRKFNAYGLLYGSQAVLADDPEYEAAKSEEVVNIKDKSSEGTPIDDAFLEALLAGTGEQGCIPGDGTTKDVVVKDVKDLATWMVGDGTVLSSGLSRHIPRAMSNLPSTSEEIILKMNKAYAQGGGKLDALFKAYFASETYSCKR